MSETIPTNKATLTVTCDYCEGGVEIEIETVDSEHIEMDVFKEIGRLLGAGGWIVTKNGKFFCCIECKNNMGMVH